MAPTSVGCKDMYTYIGWYAYLIRGYCVAMENLIVNKTFVKYGMRLLWLGQFKSQ